MTATRQFSLADRDEALRLCERGLCKSYEAAVEKVRAAPAADHCCWTKMSGGAWTRVFSGSREQCFAELTRRLGGSVTGVVLPTGVQPKDDPPPPPTQSVAVPATPRPPTPAGQYARQGDAAFAHAMQGTPPEPGRVLGPAPRQLTREGFADLVRQCEAKGDDRATAVESVRRAAARSGFALPPDAAMSMRTVPTQFSREHMERAVRLCETERISYEQAVERVRRAG